MSSERVATRLHDIVENGDAIADYLRSGTFESYLADRRTRDAVERCLEPIIEAVVKIGAEQMHAVDPTFPVDRARALGNVLRHAYDQIEERLIYNLAITEVPRLRLACITALAR